MEENGREEAEHPRHLGKIPCRATRAHQQRKNEVCEGRRAEL